MRYGIDPAMVLARGVGIRAGIPVLEVLSPPLWWKRHAVRDRSHRGRVRFGRRRLPPPGAALVDDVLTTGATMLAAHQALEGLPTLVLTATSAGRLREGEGLSAMEAK
jgi:predicted amidophosphoribosyltransferase